jgi:hypothetical protein
VVADLEGVGRAMMRAMIESFAVPEVLAREVGRRRDRDDESDCDFIEWASVDCADDIVTVG